MYFSTGVACPNDCSMHGECIDTGCECSTGYSELDCSIPDKCKMDCNRHGLCDEYECSCYPGYYGTYCQGYINCPNNCTDPDQGVCRDTGTCECFEGYSGDSCSLKEPWLLCEGTCDNGECTIDGDCQCSSGWVGVNCDIRAPIIYSTVYSSDVIIGTPDEDIVPEGTATEGNATETTEQEAEDEYVEKQADLLDDFSEEAFDDLTATQDSEATSSESSHELVPQMFGFANQEDPLAYDENTLVSATDDEEPLDWVQDIQDKQSERIDELEACEHDCHYHGVCYDNTCYCVKGYTGETCEIPDDELEDGFNISSVLTVSIVLFLLSCLIGSWYYYKLIKRIENEHEAAIEQQIE